MSDLIRREDAINKLYSEKRNLLAMDADRVARGVQIAIDAIESLPSADRPQGEWIDKAISIIDDMQREGIIDYQQAWEFRMRARMKGADDD